MRTLKQIDRAIANADFAQEVESAEHPAIDGAKTAIDDLLSTELIRAVAAFAQEACLTADGRAENQARFGIYMTRKEMASMSGVSPDAISAMVNARGKTLPQLITLARLAHGAGKKLKLSLGD